MKYKLYLTYLRPKKNVIEKKLNKRYYTKSENKKYILSFKKAQKRKS